LKRLRCLRSNAEFWRIQLPRGGEFVAEFARIQGKRATGAREKPMLFLVPS
jgi:hypothetical protein